jgi:hypothetical protein
VASGRTTDQWSRRNKVRVGSHSGGMQISFSQFQAWGWMTL